MAGRGWGKTRTGAEDVAWFAQMHPGSRIAVIAPTYADARDTCIEGESGLRNVIPSSCIEAWNRSLGELVLTNESRFKLFGAEEPDRLRGPQHHRAWADELAAWKYPETWDQLLFGLRLGQRPQVVVTTTPKPTLLVKSLSRATTTIITRGSTFDNAANLAPSALAQLRQKYEGTRLGRQELNAEILEEAEGALWNREMIERARRDSAGKLLTKAPPMKRVVVAIDPAVTAKAESNLTGIVAAGLGEDGRGYILADSSAKFSPDGWARRAIQQFDLLNADRIIAEGNQGGEMVRHTIQTERRSAPVTIVHARQGKNARAEPIAALYEQGRIGHVGEFKELEDQMCTWEPLGDMPSPDRIDAMVWALTALMVNAPVPAAMGTYSRNGGR
ncbi:terminase large subunit domain-containing protein [Bradyrhizobium elkanii]|uniref:terminase large subunit domain-containing protein n=1 Tax=Bradyrhizobium elkanii TaxID=29448 RepID=UPI003515AB70